MAQAKKKKRFFDVEIPLIGKTTQMQAFEIEEINGRFLKYDLTRILKGKGVELSLTTVVEDGQATTKPRGLKLMGYYIRRAIRKGTNYVEDSFSTNCQDAQVRVKPFLITRRKVSRAVRKALRNKAKEELVNYMKDKNSEEIFDDVLKGKIQKYLSLSLKKVYPLSFCEIRILKIEKMLQESS